MAKQTKTMKEILELEQQRLMKYPTSYLEIWHRIPEGREGMKVYFTDADNAYRARLRLYNVKKALLRTKYAIQPYGDKLWRAILSICTDENGTYIHLKLRGSVSYDDDFEEAIKRSTGGLSLDQLPRNTTTVAVDPTIDTSLIVPPEYNPEPSTKPTTPNALDEFIPARFKGKDDAK